MGQGICFHIFHPWTIGDGQCKLSEEEGPSCLSRDKPFGFSDILSVSVVSEFHEWMMGPLQPMLAL